MKVRIKHLHSANNLYLMSGEKFPRFEIIKSLEFIEMKENQVGLLLPSTTLNMQGSVFVGGEVRPKWSGHLAIELHIWRPVVIREGDVVAHLWIFEDEEPIEFEEVKE